MNTERIASRPRRGARPFARLAVPLFAFALLAGTAAGAVAEVRVDDPWVRATVDGQKASGAFMTLTSTRDARLVAVQTPAAGVAEIHEMALENNVMRMRPIDALALPAGKPVVLRPGGYHLMLLELGSALKVGDKVGLTLTVEQADGTREQVEVQAPVRPLTAGHDAKQMRGH